METLTVTIHEDKAGGYRATVKSNRRPYLDFLGKRYASAENARTEAECWITDNSPGARMRTTVVPYRPFPPGGLDSDPTCEPLH